MKNFLSEIHLKNFKSVQEIKIPCKRINIFIGKPNSGKSNLLEAISVLGRGYKVIPMAPTQYQWLKNEIRYEKFLNLFRFQNGQEPILFFSNDQFYSIRQYASRNNFEIIWGSRDYQFVLNFKISPRESIEEFQSRLVKQAGKIMENSKRQKRYAHSFLRIEAVSNEGYSNRSLIDTAPSSVRKYFYTEQKSINDPFSNYLLPSGANLYTIIEQHSSLRDFVGDFFNEYGLEFVMDSDTKQFEIHRKVNRITYKIPFSLTPDTVQRTLYHLAAIESNHDSVLLFEEPEAHSFPEYIQLVSQKIIQAKQNQFFIATHSPYLLNTFLDSKVARRELSIFITFYEDAQTKVKRLTEKEISQIHNYGVDIFYNLNTYSK